MEPMGCPYCDSAKAKSRILTRYSYTECGLENVVLIGGVQEINCPECETKYTFIPNERQLLQVITLACLMKKDPLIGSELKYIRKSCGLTQEKAAKLLAIERRATVAEREASTEPFKARWDSWVRMTFLRAFRQYLDVEGQNHLAPEHIEMMTDFECRFAAEYDYTPKKASSPKRKLPRQADSSKVEFSASKASL